LKWIMDAPQVVDDLIGRAAKARASDIHLQMTPQGAEILFRVDGVMTPITRFQPGLAEKIFGRIKYLAKLKTYQESLPQDGRIDKGEIASDHDIRVSTYPTVTGEKIVLRFFAAEAQIPLKDLGFPPEAFAEISWALAQNSGLILLTGPAGSGKTTTIYAALRELAQSGGRHIITIEDPVEQIIPGVMQTEVNEPLGLDFAKAARHLLRQDPQTLVIGEVRDEETAAICLRAATTGHLVISTLHSGSCLGALDRLALLCQDKHALGGSLRLILSQRLARKLCTDCKGAGCEHCLGTGYFGRTPLVEYSTSRGVSMQTQFNDLRQVFGPVKTLREEATRLIHAGVTNRSEIERTLGAE
jgi:type II secretory ATPase GspE/PulE/Tfp pilus assembly ATPase PilB-like protein